MHYSCPMFQLKPFRYLSVFLGLILMAPDSIAQEDMGSSSQERRYVCITMVTQVLRCGYLIDDDGREITLETPEIGVIILPKSDVISIQDAPEGARSQSMNPSSQRAQQSILNPDRAPQSSRYFFAPSALPMEQEEGYAHLNPLLLNVTRQVSENLMLGAALSWVGFGATLKASARLSDEVYGSVGAMGLVGFYNLGPTFFPFVNLTKGNQNNHASIAFAALNFDGQVSPMINFSACKEINPRVWLITENYYFADPMLFSEQLLLSVGGRWWRNNQNRLGEFALMMMITDNGEAIPIPWLGTTWPF